jgi:hypothetical protein
MERRVKSLLLGIALALSSSAFAAQPPAAPAFFPASAAFDRLIDHVVAREAANIKALRTYSPLVETYVQEMRADNELGLVPVDDRYYLTRIVFKKTLEGQNFHPKPGFLSRSLHGVTGNTRPEFIVEGFSWMMLMDIRGLDKEHYNYEYQGREFLGDLRCVILDISPKPRYRGESRFVGRVWVEDRDFNVVRFDGTYSASSKNSDPFLHFDTWRLNMLPGVWLPAYVYSQGLDQAHAKSRVGNYKAVTRVWGYNVGKGHAEEEFTEVLVDDASAVKDNSDKMQDLAPVAAERAWQRQAEDNVVERLERGGLLARTGEVDKVLNTVVNNLEITNNLDIQPEVRCRVLLTSPLESFTMGHTIFISRGMLDVLPDEASLAAVLSHELAHIVLGHFTDTTFAFKDRSTVSDSQLLRRMHFTRTQAQEQAADAKAVTLLENSPYKDKLEQFGLFLRQIEVSRVALPHLIRSDMGNSLTTGGGGDLRMKQLADTAPKLEPQKVSQVTALPMGGRIKVDPFDNRIEISKAKPVPLLTAREKMPLEVTPLFPHLARLNSAPAAEALKPVVEAVPPAPAADTTDAAR